MTTEPQWPDAYRDARVLIFGATGFIGAWLARRVLEYGGTLTVAARSTAAAASLRNWLGAAFDFVECDVRNDERVVETVARVAPHVTFNLAGYGVDRRERDEAEAHRINGRFPGVLAEAVAAAWNSAWHGAALVHAGTQLEYGPLSGKLREDRPPAPDTLYGRSKLEGTQALARAAQQHGLPSFTARLFNVYGPGERPHRLLPSLRRAAERGEPIPLTSGEQRVDFVHVEDVAEGLMRIALASDRPGDIVNLASGRLTSVRRFAELAARLMGMPLDRLQFGALPARAETLRYDAVSIRRLRQLTGWSPPADVEAGIRRTLEHHGWAYARN